MRLVEAGVEEIDSRRVTPADVLDAVKGAVEGGNVKHCIAITESEEGELRFILTDMTNTQFIGTLAIAMQNYIHLFQHNE